MEEDYLKPSQVAKRLRVDVTTVIRWIKNGALEAEKVHYRQRYSYRIKNSAIEKIEAPKQ